MDADPKRISRWAKWVLDSRYGSSEADYLSVSSQLTRERERILDSVALAPDCVFLDLGCGEGLLGFGVLERLQGSQVIFVDISSELIEHVEERAQRQGVTDRCRFLVQDIVSLDALADETADVAAVRSLFIYIQDQSKALKEVYRVLSPGGQIVVSEPLNSYWKDHSDNRGLWGYWTESTDPIIAKIKQFYRSWPGTKNRFFEVDEKEFALKAANVGFESVRIDMTAKLSGPPLFRSWQSLLAFSPNPTVPSLSEVIEEVCTRAEAMQLETALAPAVEAGNARQRMAVAYFTAKKPGAGECHA